MTPNFLMLPGMVEYRRPPSEGHNRSVLTLETAAALARTEL